MLRTELGGVAIACAAVDDVTGWIILAVLMLLARASETALPLWATFLGVGVYVVIMLFPLRRLMCWIEDYYQQTGPHHPGYPGLDPALCPWVSLDDRIPGNPRTVWGIFGWCDHAAASWFCACVHRKAE